MAAGTRGFAPARRSGTSVPRVQSQKYKTSEAIIIGSLVVSDANGELTVCGADPTAVKGVALEAAGTKANYGEPFVSQTVFATGRVQECSIAIADDDTEFSAELQSDATTLVTPAQTHIGEEYGVAKRTDNSWYIDTSETTTKVVRITDIVEAQGNQLGYVLCRFLPATHAAS